jgi:hypothetical protein
LPHGVFKPKDDNAKNDEPEVPYLPGNLDNDVLASSLTQITANVTAPDIAIMSNKARYLFEPFSLLL